MADDMYVSVCRHCHRRIVRVNYAMGEKWMHQPQGAAFQDDQYWFCQVTAAEPGAVQPASHIAGPSSAEQIESIQPTDNQ